MFNRSDYHTGGSSSVVVRERRHSYCGSMSGSSRKHRPTSGRCHHGLEWLEPRCLLAANLTNIVAVQPYNGAQLTQSPQELVLTFNQPNVNIAIDATTFDFQLERVNRDGTLTPVFDPNNPPPEVVNSESASVTTFNILLQESVDPIDNWYYNLTLQPGKYEVELLAGVGISIDASGANGPGPELWDPNQPHVVSEFTVLGSGATLGGATPLGTTVTGYLNPDQYQAAVDFYQFTLAQGNLWQVGLSVSAHSIGSGLRPALTLFDAQGNVLATRDSGSGLPADPTDPFLITGLPGGTYFVGVSGAGNLPYGSDGYDPVLGIPGSAGLKQPGGPFEFQLSLAAQPHVQSTGLVNFTVDRADRLDPSPTGLTLTFNGPIDVSTIFVPDTQETALQVVDSSGRVWPMTAEEYQVTDARLTLIFDQPLPAGHYSLVIPPQGGLTDLAGLPVTAAGEPSGVLAAWTVASSTWPSVADNLGTLWPASATDPALAGVFSQTTDLAPGQTETYRWVVTVPGFFKLQTQMESGAVSVVNSGNGSTTVLDPGTTHQLNTYLMDLGDGVYGLRFINTGSQPAVVHWKLKIASLDWEKIVYNGVGQGSALSLLLFSPTPSDPTGNSIASFQATSGSAAVSVFPGSSGPLPASLFVTLNTGLIGQPTPAGQNVTPVGPTVDEGSIAVADSTTGLQPGLRYESMSAPGPGQGNSDQSGEVKPAGAGPVANDQAIRLAARGSEQLRLDPEADSARADERALAQSEWLVRLGSRMKSWLMPSPAGSEIKSHAAAPSEAMAMVGNDAAAGSRGSRDFNRNKRSTSSAQADMGAAASLIMAGAVAYRLRQPCQKWWRRRDRLASAGPAPAKPFCPGPHRVSTRARVTTRARKVHSVP
ncbi:MAG: DVUA0089 family protein [Isosphaerales bacterium]